ncbi:hypothetical protein E2C01_032575 [Portunus trituberculatus]|uniref:Uncharacterized protein n=1 Tax=Portunus trituberculatus TaxID=210409 RepID=A0A5B7F132_PORTR|nr:hypothetical protein [Portunus trituberculatus]
MQAEKKEAEERRKEKKTNIRGCKACYLSQRCGGPWKTLVQGPVKRNTLSLTWWLCWRGVVTLKWTVRAGGTVGGKEKEMEGEMEVEEEEEKRERERVTV